MAAGECFGTLYLLSEVVPTTAGGDLSRSWRVCPVKDTGVISAPAVGLPRLWAHHGSRKWSISYTLKRRLSVRLHDRPGDSAYPPREWRRPHLRA